MIHRAAFSFILLLAAAVASAQSKTGTSIAQFMGIEPGSRHAAMGNAGVALDAGIQSAYYNPASLGALGGPVLQFTHSDWFAGIDYDYAAGAVPLAGLGTVFGSVTALNSGDIDVRTVTQPLGTGERYAVSDLALGLGFGRRITSRFAAGAQVNYVTETIWHTSQHLLTFNVGTVYLLGAEGLKLGASINNIGTRGRFDGRDLAIQYDQDPDRNGDNSALPGGQFTDRFPVPILFRVGLAYPRPLGPDSRLLLALDAFHPSDNTESLSGGAEWSWKDTVALRAGYQHLFRGESDLGLTLGAGIGGRLGERRFDFDYAWADHDFLQETHRLTFVLSF